jgi:hypothetical protein
MPFIIGILMSVTTISGRRSLNRSNRIELYIRECFPNKCADYIPDNRFIFNVQQR